MCYLEGILDRSGGDEVFKLRISAFGKNTDPGLHASEEVPIPLTGALMRVLATVTIHPRTKDLHAITLTWAGAASRDEIMSAILRIPKYVEGLGGGGKRWLQHLLPSKLQSPDPWRENSPLVVEAFFNAQNTLRAVLDGAVASGAQVSLLEERRSPAWVSRGTPPNPDVSGLNLAEYEHLESPSWLTELSGDQDVAFISGALQVGALAKGAVEICVEPMPATQRAARESDAREYA